MSVVIFNNMFDDFLISMPLVQPCMWSNIIWDVLNISTNQEPEGFLLLPARISPLHSLLTWLRDSQTSHMRTEKRRHFVARLALLLPFCSFLNSYSVLLLPWRHSTNHSTTIVAIRLIRAMFRYIILYYFKDSAMSCYVDALVILFS